LATFFLPLAKKKKTGVQPIEFVAFIHTAGIDFLCAHITTKAMPEVGSKVALSTPQTLENNGGDGRIANPNGRVLRPAFTQGGRRARRGRIYKRRGKEERSATAAAVGG